MVLLDDSTNLKEIPVEDSKSVLEINLGLHLLAISQLDEVEESFTSRFQLYVSWKDYRLSYQNLVKNKLENVLDDKIARRLWIPPLMISSAKGNAPFIANDKSVTMAINQLSKPETKGLEAVHEAFYFSGRKNDIFYMNMFDVEQICQFDLTDYPFDTQSCPINISIAAIFEKKLNLQYDKEWIKNKIKGGLNQFSITGLEGILDKDNKTLSIVIKMKRQISYIAVSVFFPTICLFIIATLTLYIDPCHFEATIMVSLTTMLVTYTLYQSISDSLPKTGTIKLIDIWLVAGMILPFMVFLLLVIVEIMPDKLRPGCQFLPGKSTNLKEKVLRMAQVIVTLGVTLFIFGFLFNAYTAFSEP